MMIVKANYNEELVNAGVLVDLSGLQSSSKGFRVRFSGGKTSIIDGPFAETRELIAGYWVINVKSRQDAVDWARKIPATNESNEESEIEVRQFFELEDFAPGAAVDHHKEVGKKLAAGKK
jgi:hypothetical protein